MACGLAEWIAGIGIATIMIITIAGLFQYSRFLARLRVEHPMKWQDLGKSELVTVEGSETDRATSVFILRAYYRDLNDPELTRMGDGIRMLGFINIAVVFVIGVVLANQLDGNLSRLACFSQ